VSLHNLLIQLGRKEHPTPLEEQFVAGYRAYSSLCARLDNIRMYAPRGVFDGVFEAEQELRELIPVYQRHHPAMEQYLRVITRTTVDPIYHFQVLNDRDRMTLRLLTRNAGDQEIAQQLGCAVSTVRTYVRNIERKLGVSTRQEASRYAQKAGVE
jgi:DNA-binding CsgD family transcriptional regulator